MDMHPSVAVGRLVVVPASLLDDLLELARLSADRLPDSDPLRSALLGSISGVRCAAILEPI